jgi:outer membrane protein assembly factor BamC
METDWAENRAKIPQDFIRNATWQNDRWTRCTRPPNETSSAPASSALPSGETEIYISHRGMIEVFPSGSATPTTRDTTTLWQPRPTDPELEAEFLRKPDGASLGVSQEQSEGDHRGRHLQGHLPRL